MFPAIAVLLTIIFAIVSLFGETRETDDSNELASEDIVETFLLTPIQMDSFGVEVPAEMVAITNNSCRDWTDRADACYLPPHILTSTSPSKQPQLTTLLERHLSSVLNSWKSGAWPVGGCSINYALKQYASLEHLWVTTRIEITEMLGSCWLTGKDDAYEVVLRATSQPAAEIRIEVFDDTRNAQGYPHKKGL